MKSEDVGLIVRDISFDLFKSWDSATFVRLGCLCWLKSLDLGLALVGNTSVTVGQFGKLMHVSQRVKVIGRCVID